MALSSSKNAFSSIKLISLNVGGLNIPEKRSQLLQSMHKNNADIIFLQETHFKTNSIPKLFNVRYPISLHATNQTSKTKGVSIIIAKHCPFLISDTCLDRDGRTFL